MKKLLLYFAIIIAFNASAQVSDATLTTSANTIKNETAPRANTATRNGQMLLDIINSKPSLLGSYSNPSWITGLNWSKILSTPTTLAGYGITDAVGHAIQDEGSSVTQRAIINFAGAGVTVTDAGGKTLVTIPGGGGSVSDADATTKGIAKLYPSTSLGTNTDGAPDQNAVKNYVDVQDAGRQPIDGDLTAIAGLSHSDGDFIQDVSGTWSRRTLSQTKTALGIDAINNTSDANKPVSTAQQTALNLKQNADQDLTDIAAIVPSNDDIIQRKGGVWVNRTIAQLKTDFAPTPVSALTAASALDGTELLAGVQSAVSKKITTAQVKTLVSASPTLVTPNLGTPSAGVLTNATGLPISTGTTGTLPVNRGGTGTTTPGIVAGANVTVTGTWPNQTVNSSGGGGSSTFVSLTDGPGAFTGNGLKVVRVNSGATALEYATVSGTGDVVGPASAVDGAPVVFDGTTGKLIKSGANAWSSWTPTVSGSFTGGVTTNCRYRYNSIDKILTIWFDITGTATTPAAIPWTFTLPLSLVGSASGTQTLITQGVNSSAGTTSMCTLTAGANTVSCFLASTGTGNWGTSGTKGMRGSWVIEVQ